jgi:hypothetical protein
MAIGEKNHERLGVSITDILPVYGLLIFVSGIVISVKILGLKFVPYIADTCNRESLRVCRRYL